MAEGPTHRMTGNLTNDRSIRIEYLRSIIPLGEIIKFPAAMTQAQLQQIPKATITKEQADSLFQCAVCFHEFKSNEDEVRKLPCNHMYHDKCIFPWLLNNPSCPTCRAPILNQHDDFEDIIQQHYDFLTRDLMRHLAESGLALSVTANARRPTRGARQGPEEENNSASTRRLDTPVATVRGTGDVRVPRRAAALRAGRAIQQMYCSQRRHNR